MAKGRKAKANPFKKSHPMQSAAATLAAFASDADDDPKSRCVNESASRTDHDGEGSGVQACCNGSGNGTASRALRRRESGPRASRLRLGPTTVEDESPFVAALAATTAAVDMMSREEAEEEEGGWSEAQERTMVRACCVRVAATAAARARGRPKATRAKLSRPSRWRSRRGQDHSVGGPRTRPRKAPSATAWLSGSHNLFHVQESREGGGKTNANKKKKKLNSRDTLNHRRGKAWVVKGEGQSESGH